MCTINSSFEAIAWNSWSPSRKKKEITRPQNYRILSFFELQINPQYPTVTNSILPWFVNNIHGRRWGGAIVFWERHNRSSHYNIYVVPWWVVQMIYTSFNGVISSTFFSYLFPEVSIPILDSFFGTEWLPTCYRSDLFEARGVKPKKV